MKQIHILILKSMLEDLYVEYPNKARYKCAIDVYIKDGATSLPFLLLLDSILILNYLCSVA